MSIDNPAQQAAINANQLRLLARSKRKLVSLKNGERRWVVFASDIEDQANREVRPFVETKRLSADYIEGGEE